MSQRPTLILLPGQLCDSDLFGAQLQGLSDIADMRVADLTLDDSVAGMAERVLAAAPPRFAMAAVSLGGYVALEIVRRAGARMTHLALMNSSARPDTDAQQARRAGNIAAVQVGTFKGVTPRLLPSILHSGHVNDPHIAGTVMAMAERVGRKAFETQQRAIAGRPDSRPVLGQIACPTLIIGGRADKLTPPALQEELAAAIPGAKLVVLEKCGHLAPLEQPEVVNGLLRELLGAG